MKLTSNVAKFGSRSVPRLDGDRSINCRVAQKLMSPYIDSMATAEESQQLDSHIEYCPPCGRQLQSFISVRNLLARVEQPVPPKDMILESRVKLSHERNDSSFEWLKNRLANAFDGMAVPALGGVLATMLLFGLLFGALVTGRAGDANNDRLIGVARVAPTPVAATPATVAFFASNDKGGLKEPLMIALQVGDDGLPFGYSVLTGGKSREAKDWIAETLLLARFSPATAFGKPVGSTIILSFVAVRS